jgi:hypothetical protein
MNTTPVQEINPVRIVHGCVGDQAFWIWARLPKSRMCKVVAMCHTAKQAEALLGAGYPGVDDELWITFVEPVSQMSWRQWTAWREGESVGRKLKFQNRMLVEA